MNRGVHLFISWSLALGMVGDQLGRFLGMMRSIFEVIFPQFARQSNFFQTRKRFAHFEASVSEKLININ